MLVEQCEARKVGSGSRGLGKEASEEGKGLGEGGPRKPGRQEPQLEMSRTIQDWRGGSKHERQWERAKKGT